jgi:hypothetical protein
MQTAQGVTNIPIRDAPFWIAAQVYVCATTDGAVLLDLKRDKYYGLGREDSELLADAVEGWPAPSWNRMPEPHHSQGLRAQDLCLSLLEDGLLTRNECADHPMSRVPRIDMAAEFVAVGDELEVRGCVRLGHIASFVAAYISARYSLRWRPFIRVVDGMRSAKIHGAKADYAYDILAFAALVDIFRRLRPYVFTAEGRCLLHALTLVKFLNRHGLYPEWVVAVTTHPWGAHSWVQWGNFLLDTNPDKVCQYTPIMVV